MRMLTALWDQPWGECVPTQKRMERLSTRMHQRCWSGGRRAGELEQIPSGKAVASTAAFIVGKSSKVRAESSRQAF